MENRRDGFGRYLRDLEQTRRPGRSAALVMNANPFTLGHRYLAETAAAACDTLHLFLVSEDASLVPFSVRKELARGGPAPPRLLVVDHILRLPDAVNHRLRLRTGKVGVGTRGASGARTLPASGPPRRRRISLMVAYMFPVVEHIL